MAHPFVRLQHLGTGYERRRLERPDVVELAAFGALDFEGVPKSLRRHHPDVGSVALDDRVGADGDAVDEAFDGAEIGDEGGDGIQNSDGRFVRSRRDFRPSQRAVRGVERDCVGERSADVDPDAAAWRIAGHESGSPVVAPEDPRSRADPDDTATGMRILAPRSRTATNLRISINRVFAHPPTTDLDYVPVWLTIRTSSCAPSSMRGNAPQASGHRRRTMHICEKGIIRGNDNDKFQSSLVNLVLGKHG